MQKLRNIKVFPIAQTVFFDDAMQVPDYFELSVNCNPQNTDITMRLFSEEVTTQYMNHITRLLSLYLPTILHSTCFNEDNLPFHKEVSHTEIGHLFEHILLEYLCKEKINTGSREAVFSGVTKWNWNKEKVGTFHISIDVREDEKELLYFALEQSILLLKRIMHYHVLGENFTSVNQAHTNYFPSLGIEKQMA